MLGLWNTLTSSTPLAFYVIVVMYFNFGSAGKNPSAVQETQVPSLGREDLLEKEMATHSSILAWEIPWTGFDTIEQVNHMTYTTKLYTFCTCFNKLILIFKL